MRDLPIKGVLCKRPFTCEGNYLVLFFYQYFINLSTLPRYVDVPGIQGSSFLATEADIGVRCLWLCRVRLPGCVWFIRFGHLHLPGKIKKAYSLQLIIFVSMEVVITIELLILNLFMPKMEYLFRNRAKTLQPTLKLSMKKHSVSLLLQVHAYQSPQ